MKAVILAGGLGTRLRPVTLEIPKALIPIQGKTLTEHVIDILKKAGVDTVYLSIGYLHEKISDYFKDGSNFGIKIKYIIESEPLGTGGWMHIIPKEELSENFFVVNGDNLFDLDINSFLNFHDSNSAVATISLITVLDVSSYGIVEISSDKILRFVEKPKKEDAPSNLANSGYYIFNKRAFNYIPNEKKFSLEKDFFPKLANEGVLFGFPENSLWFDTGTFERWEEVIKNWRCSKKQ